MECPECSGKGEHFAYINTGNDYSEHKAGNVVCLRCKGKKEVPDEMASWIADGKRIRSLMLDRGLTMLSVSAGLGVTVATVSSILTGYVDKETLPALEPWILQHDIVEGEQGMKLSFDKILKQTVRGYQ